VAHPEIALFVDEVPASALDSVRADLVFRLGEPVTAPTEGQEENVGDDTGITIPLAWDEIVVILHPENNASIADLDVLQGLFSGQIMRWDELDGPVNPVQVWIYPEGEEARQIFDTIILGKAKNTSLAGIAPDPAAMLEAVSADPNAIGYLPLSWITEETPQLRIEKGFFPGLRQPLLALAGEEPEGATLILLNCLQGEDGQAVVRNRYQTSEK
jgi:ABC-type phosphate transport system substrate-binding protein